MRYEENNFSRVTVSPVSHFYVPKIIREDGLGIITAKNNGVSMAMFFSVQKPPYDNKMFARR